MGSTALHQSESAVLWRYRNREIRAADLDSFRLLLAEHGQVGRKAFPRIVCQAWGWRQANGAWSECACRDLLLRLEERGRSSCHHGARHGRGGANCRSGRLT